MDERFAISTLASSSLNWCPRKIGSNPNRLYKWPKCCYHPITQTPKGGLWQCLIKYTSKGRHEAFSDMLVGKQMDDEAFPTGHHEVFSDMLVHKQMGNEEGLPGHKVISDVLRSVIHPPGVFHDDRKLNFGQVLAGAAAVALPLTLSQVLKRPRPPAFGYGNKYGIRNYGYGSTTDFISSSEKTEAAGLWLWQQVRHQELRLWL